MALLLIAMAGILGCTPPGPKALLDGKELLDSGKPAQAVEKLRVATTLLKTNAHAWNYFGLALHHSGQLAEAEKAYQQALLLNPDLTEARYNLGSVWLAQNKLEQAKGEFTAYTLRQGRSADAFTQLGLVQLRLRELSAAEKSLGDALRLNPNEPQALNGMGMVRVQRGRATEAVQYFNDALKREPGYGPALLNLAITAQNFLRNTNLAVQKYREYLSVEPAAPDAGAVKQLVTRLEEETTPPRPPPVIPPAALAPATNRMSAVVQPARAAAESNSPPRAQPQTVAPPQKPVAAAAPKSAEVASSTTNASATQPGKTATNAAAAKTNKPSDTAPVAKTPRPAAPPTAAPKAEQVHLPDEPAIKAGREVSVGKARETATKPELATTVKPQKEAPVPVASEFATGGPRYPYRKQITTSKGNRDQAERYFKRGVAAHDAQRFREAIQEYRRAAQSDPSYFDAHYNLGLAASAAGDLKLALSAYEDALAVQPRSLDARYNFALGLKQSGYLGDAAAELARILSMYPEDSRAHLVLGNLYSQQLQNVEKARAHYLKVLETDPRNPQAATIRYWLAEHPQ